MELACQTCKDNGKATDCKHMLHLVPSWQSSEKHIRLKKVSVYMLASFQCPDARVDNLANIQVMEDRPDLIASELSGLAFDSLQQCFRCVWFNRALSGLCSHF